MIYLYILLYLLGVIFGTLLGCKISGHGWFWRIAKIDLNFGPDRVLYAFFILVWPLALLMFLLMLPPWVITFLIEKCREKRLYG